MIVDKPGNSLEKGIAVLNAFNSPQRTRGVTDLARELELPKSTVHRILSTFVSAGWIQRLPGGRYRLGFRMFELGAVVLSQIEMRRVASPYLHELHHRTHLTVFLSVLDGEDIIHLDHIPGRGSSRIKPTIGKRWNLHTSTAGKLFLAFGPPDLLARYIQHGLSPLTPFSITTAPALMRDLQVVRESGYAVEHNEAVVGVSGMAAGVTGPTGSLIAAVTIAGEASAVYENKSHARETARAVSQALNSRSMVRAISDTDRS